MEQYNVIGMSCAACSARVEKAVSQLDGVESCTVSLLTNSMGVTGTVSADSVIAAVEAAGYGAAVKGTDTEKKDRAAGADEEMLKDRETPVLKKRLIASLCFLIPLMYFSMGHMMWSWPVPAFLAGNHVAMGLIQLILTGMVMVINQKFFISGMKGLIHKAPNMDTLVALGAGASFIYSTVALFAMTDAQMKMDMDTVMSWMHEFYFESAAMILTLITVGKMLEAHSKGKTTDALKSLMKLAPKTAVVVRDGIEQEVPIEQVKKGEIFLVRPGENIPVDGIVLEGSSAVNEAALTGESIPVDKEIGDAVSAATLNQSGFLKCEATRVGEDTTLSQIIQMVSDAAATKAPIAKVADKVSGVFVPVVISIAAVTILVWLLMGESVGFALARGISVLVISCPCALGLATPVAIMVGNGMGAKNGIMFKTAVSLEETGKMEIVALDKTGTITSGDPKVTDIIPVENVTEEELLKLAYALEQKSEHPLAGAILMEAAKRGLEAKEVIDFQAVPGNGLTARLQMAGQEQLSGGEADSIILRGGNLKFISDRTKVPEEIKSISEQLAEEGKTPLFFSRDNELIGIIAVADVIKEDSPRAVRELQNMGIHVVMLTGDNERTAKAIGKQAGVDEVIAGVLPEGKESVIRSLKQKGKVAMVGDGINDAPALTRADMGIAIGAGTDIAIDAADVVLMKSRLSDVPAAIRMSRATLRNIHENLFWAFIYNAIGIPLAAGLFYPIFGWKLNPMFGAAAMSLSSFCVVSNALRLNWFKLHDAGRDKSIKVKSKKKQEEITMTKTMKIEGMMCGHCEAAVKKALEALAEVDAAEVSHETGTAVITLNAELADEVLKKTVEDKDYKVLSVE
ncbi:heavy metal translocating P-type ATPase [Mediterraneibacter agrestimuris]|uniref:heavy metal translocating P-type ATPase n=1 Tax=Mediterraneibacter agrestimuris TaxID=2941333 RepID=UPI00203CFCB6|nr:heavy metal translocating P-type ATPase [Mediterraneibacter agrestimuris]